MTGAIENEPTADVELWTLYQWTCHDCPAVDGVPVAYGDAETLAEAQRAIIRHKQEIHGEFQPPALVPVHSEEFDRVMDREPAEDLPPALDGIEDDGAS